MFWKAGQIIYVNLENLYLFNFVPKNFKIFGAESRHPKVSSVKRIRQSKFYTSSYGFYKFIDESGKLKI